MSIYGWAEYCKKCGWDVTTTLYSDIIYVFLRQRVVEFKIELRCSICQRLIKETTKKVAL